MQPAYYAKIFESGAQQSCLHVLEVSEASFLNFFFFFQKMIFLCCIVPIYIHIFLLISKSVQVIAAGDLCAICQEKMHAPILLRCKHIFCEDCVSEWWVSKSMQVFSFPNFLPYIFHACLVQTFHFEFNLFYIALLKLC